MDAVIFLTSGYSDIFFILVLRIGTVLTLVIIRLNDKLLIEVIMY